MPQALRIMPILYAVYRQYRNNHEAMVRVQIKLLREQANTVEFEMLDTNTSFSLCFFGWWFGV